MTITDRPTSTLQVSDCPVLVLAAGFGKRLGSLTATKPKPLICVAGKPLIDWTLEALECAGFRRVFINLHYLGDKLRDYVVAKWNAKFLLQFIEEPIILDTGGAIKNIESLLLPNDYLFTVNADTLFGKDFSFAGLLSEHLAHSRAPYATLVVREDVNARNYGELGVDESGMIAHFVGKDYTPKCVKRGLIYTGIQLINPKLLPELPPRGTVFSITRDTYTQLLREGKVLSTFEYSGFWSDVGTPERLAAAECALNHTV